MTPDGTFCADCGSPIQGEVSGDRSPCPNCGATARRHDLSASLTVTVHAIGELDARSYPDVLFDTAGQMIAQQQFAIAIIVVHIACEVAVDRALSRLFAASRTAFIENAVRESLNGYSLANERVRNLYNALTGKTIQRTENTFWAEFKKSAKHRNEIVHGGKKATREEANAALEAGKALVKYVAI